eukprot:352673-Chlamydomonas_euryale.AAC.1
MVEAAQQLVRESPACRIVGGSSGGADGGSGGGIGDGADSGGAGGDGVMRAEVGDAAELAEMFGEGSAAVVFSAFGLQQLGPRAPEVRHCVRVGNMWGVEYGQACKTVGKQPDCGRELQRCELTCRWFL